MLTTLKLEENTQGVILPVRAQPGARKNAILGVREGALRVAVTSAPEKGKANQAIIAVLAKSLGVSKSTIELRSGETSRQKKFLITGMRIQELRDGLSIVCDPD